MPASSACMNSSSSQVASASGRLAVGGLAVLAGSSLLLAPAPRCCLICAGKQTTGSKSRLQFCSAQIGPHEMAE